MEGGREEDGAGIVLGRFGVGGVTCLSRRPPYMLMPPARLIGSPPGTRNRSDYGVIIDFATRMRK